MKILYGIQLTGNGHITRSIQIIKSLKESGCEVDIITSGNNSQLEIPSIGIGNQYSFLSKNIPRPKTPNKISEMFLKKFAKCDYNIALNYQKYDEFISLPIISENLLGKETSEENFYLVYLPSLATNYILEQLKDFNCYDWKIYSSDVKEDYIDDKVQMKKLNKEGFTEDLLNCKGVITASGFSTTTEALVLNKKIWSIPIKGQYEQLCNAIALKRMGVFTEDLNKDTISKWITNYQKIDYDWNNPIDEIVQKIINHNEKN